MKCPRRISRISLLIGLCLLMAFMASSCSKAPATATELEEKKPEVTVASGGTGVTITQAGETGTNTVSVNLKEGVTIPEGYPSKIAPLYPRGTATMAGLVEKTYTVVIQSNDSADDVYAFYKKNLKLDTVELSQNMTGLIMISGTKDSWYVSLMTSQSVIDGKNMQVITIAVMPKS